MRAQSQRKLIWILNAALGLGVLALAAWIVVKVRPAVADPDYLRPRWAGAAEKAFAAQPPPASGGRLGSQVEEQEISEIDQPQFKTKQGRRYHWLYSGPMPPPPPEEVKPDAGPKTPIEDDLSKLGRVRMLMYIPPDTGDEVASATVVFWEFRSGTRTAFSPGEFFQEPKSKGAATIKLVDVRPKPARERIYELIYEVYEDPQGEPLKRATYDYDGTINLDPLVDQRVKVTGVRGSGTGSTLPAEAADGATGASRPGVVVVGGEDRPDAAADMSQLQPTIVEEGVDRYRVEFDDATFDFVRRGDPERFAQSIKTQVAEDPDTGEPKGLRITGIDPGTPADKFDVKAGDVLVSINDRPVRSRSDALNIAQSLPPETERVKVVIERRNRQITFTIDPRDPQTRRAANTLNPDR